MPAASWPPVQKRDHAPNAAEIEVGRATSTTCMPGDDQTITPTVTTEYSAEVRVHVKRRRCSIETSPLGAASRLTERRIKGWRARILEHLRRSRYAAL